MEEISFPRHFGSKIFLTGVSSSLAYPPHVVVLASVIPSLSRDLPRTNHAGLAIASTLAETRDFPLPVLEHLSRQAVCYPYVKRRAPFVRDPVYEVLLHAAASPRNADPSLRLRSGQASSG